MRSMVLALLFITVHAAYGKSVTDYFLEMPAEKIGLVLDTAKGGAPSLAQRKASVRVRDDKNGYLEIEHPDMIAKFAVALFQRKAGTPWIAVNRSMGDARNLGTLTFWDPTTDWKDVTAEVLPKLDPAALEKTLRKNSKLARKRSGQLTTYVEHPFFRLPRRGTSITIVCAADEEGYWGASLGTLAFNGETFAVTAE